MNPVQPKRWIRRAWFCLLCAAITATSSFGAEQLQGSDATRNTDSALIKRLLARVDELEAEVRQIKGAGSVKAVEPEAAAPSKQAQPAELAVAHSESHGLVAPGLQIRGFADVGFGASNEKGTTNSFGLGQIDLFMTSRLSENISALGELVFESGDDNKIGADFERMLIQYAPSDYFRLGVGRYHTSIGYYNTAYHHGTWFQTAIGRPFLFRFEDEGGVLPIHNVGLTATGRVPSGRLGLSYVVELGNGRAYSKDAEAVQNVHDENNGKALNVGMKVRPDRIPGFQAGFSWYRDRLTPSESSPVNEGIAAAHVVYDVSSWNLLVEGVLLRHSPINSRRTFNTPAFYSQVSRHFGKQEPYFRYEYMNALRSDPILAGVGLRHWASAGIKHAVGEFSAIKFEYQRQLRSGQKDIHSLQTQLAFTF